MSQADTQVSDWSIQTVQTVRYTLCRHLSIPAACLPIWPVLSPSFIAFSPHLCYHITNIYQKGDFTMKPQTKKGPAALLPILIFLIIYIGVGIYYEYIHPQEGVQGFYVMSVVVAFMAAIAVALFQNRSVSFDEKLKICASGMGDDNILTMIFIFLLAGAFSGVASASGCAADTANMLLSFVPNRLTVLGIFLISCIISMAMGTSCGTITVMGSLALSISQSAGLSLPDRKSVV